MSRYSDVWMGQDNYGLNGSSSGYATYETNQVPRKVSIKRIRQLERDLSVEIVIQEEVSHIRHVQKCSYTHGIWDEWEEDEKVIDKPRIAKPDTQKRQAARAELQQIYDNSKWYNFLIRHSVMKALASPSPQVISD